LCLAVDPNPRTKLNGAVFNAPFQGGAFQTQFVSSVIPIPNNGSPNRIEFSPLGDFVVTIDGATNKIYVLK
jgi:hypothetical protein